MDTVLLVLALLPSLAWLIFYLREDMHPEPPMLLAITFIAGALFAFAAFFAQILIGCGYLVFSLDLPCEIKTAAQINIFSMPPLFVLVFALVEELAKFGAAYLVVRRNKAFNEPVDAMVYVVTAALGFAALENLGVIRFGDFPESSALSRIFELVSLRFVGATLLHSLTAAIIGYYWAVSIRDFGAKRPLLAGLAIATVLHAFFNFLIIQHGVTTYSVILLLIAGFFVLNDFEKLRKRAV